MLINNNSDIDFSELNQRIEYSKTTCDIAQETMEPKDLTLPQLLSLHDEEFIRAAFKQLLRRDVDDIGKDFYLSALRTGTPPIFILASLRYSFEGQQVPEPISGLYIILWLQKLAKIPKLERFITFIINISNRMYFQRQAAIKPQDRYKENKQLQDHINALQKNQKKLSTQLLSLEKKYNALLEQQDKG